MNTDTRSTAIVLDALAKLDREERAQARTSSAG
jgi:hypothetical protein